MAGGKKSPWFLDSWNSKEAHKECSFDYEDAKDLPIELRRLEDCDDAQEHPTSNVKSRSLGSILNPPILHIVRSRSSVPSLGQESKMSNMHESPIHDARSGALNCSQNISFHRPKLTKQKQSINFMDDIEFSLHDSSFNFNNDHQIRSQSFRKQSSLNEELMAESRIREKERIRKKIQKQMSLNETFLCRSLLSKRLQTLREGLTTKLKTSTGSLERMTKSNFVKIIQNIKTANNVYSNEDIHTKMNQFGEKENEKLIEMKAYNLKKNKSYDMSCKIEPNEKFRKESGSDSSKESSLQSDTSVESEDSFASVIYIPKNPEIVTTNKQTSPLICPTPTNSPAANSDNFQRQLTSNNFTCFSFETQTGKQNHELNTSDNLKITKPKNENLFKVKTSLTENSISKMGLSPIPKYKKLSSFPIVKRSSSSNILSKNVMVPKLTSLELFNPEIDDIDSESSEDEPSSSDSIDSVISNFNHLKNSLKEPIPNNFEVSHLIDSISTNSCDTFKIIKTESKNQVKPLVKLDKKIHINGNDDTDVKAEILNKYSAIKGSNEDIIEFVDKVNIQLLKKINDSTNIIQEKPDGKAWNKNEITNTESKKIKFKTEKTNENDEEESPPLSAKIQSHLSQNAGILPSSQNLIIRQQPKISDFILEENEDFDEDDYSKALKEDGVIENEEQEQEEEDDEVFYNFVIYLLFFL